MGMFPNCHGIYSHRVNVGKNNADDLLIKHVHFRASHVCGHCRILSNAFPGPRFDVRTLIPGPIAWPIDLEYVPPRCVIGLPRSLFWAMVQQSKRQSCEVIEPLRVQAETCDFRAHSFYPTCWFAHPSGKPDSQEGINSINTQSLTTPYKGWWEFHWFYIFRRLCQSISPCSFFVKSHDSYRFWIVLGVVVKWSCWLQNDNILAEPHPTFTIWGKAACTQPLTCTTSSVPVNSSWSCEFHGWKRWFLKPQTCRYDTI